MKTIQETIREIKDRQRVRQLNDPNSHPASMKIENDISFLVEELEKIYPSPENYDKHQS
jgi:hypothetical protein